MLKLWYCFFPEKETGQELEWLDQVHTANELKKLAKNQRFLYERSVQRAFEDS